MLLLGTSSSDPDNIELAAVTRGDGEGSGVPGGDALARFVNATFGTSDGSLQQARQAVIDELGQPAMIDAAGVMATFTIMNRVADVTGLPLDPPMEIATRKLRAEIGADAFATANNTPEGGMLSRLVAPAVQRLVPFVMRRMGGKS